MKAIQFIAPIVVALGVAVSAHALSLEDGFKAPPCSAKPQTWYHLMNGNVTKEGVTRDFEELAKAGIGGIHRVRGSSRRGVPRALRGLVGRAVLGEPRPTENSLIPCGRRA